MSNMDDFESLSKPELLQMLQKLQTWVREQGQPALDRCNELESTIAIYESDRAHDSIRSQSLEIHGQSNQITLLQASSDMVLAKHKELTSHAAHLDSKLQQQTETMRELSQQLDSHKATSQQKQELLDEALDKNTYFAASLAKQEKVAHELGALVTHLQSKVADSHKLAEANVAERMKHMERELRAQIEQEAAQTVDNAYHTAQPHLFSIKTIEPLGENLECVEMDQEQSDEQREWKIKYEEMQLELGEEKKARETIEMEYETLKASFEEERKLAVSKDALASDSDSSQDNGFQSERVARSRLIQVEGDSKCGFFQFFRTLL